MLIWTLPSKLSIFYVQRRNMEDIKFLKIILIKRNILHLRSDIIFYDVLKVLLSGKRMRQMLVKIRGSTQSFKFYEAYK